MDGFAGFIGRDAEIGKVEAALRRARLVTVTGPPGVGKSTLARRVAARAGGRVTVVDLDDDGDPSDLPGGLPGDKAAELPEVTAGLLVLDGCDRAIDEIAPRVRALMQANPRLRVLATSRQSLTLPGEQVIVLTELGPDARAALLEHLAGQAAEPPDGLPLTAELLAAALRRGEPADVTLDRLADPGRPGPSRHTSMRTAIGASHEACTAAERILWARASVFAGGFDLEAAQRVCGAAPLDEDAVLGAVAALVDKSVLVRSEGPLGVRFRLVESLRMFGAEWLDRLGETPYVQEWHFEHFIRLARQAEREWQGGQVWWYQRMRLEAPNLRQTLEWRLADPGTAEQAQDLGGTLWFLWACCGLQREGAGYLDRALAARDEPGPVRTKALLTSAWLDGALGDLAGAERRLAECGDGPRAAHLAAVVAVQRGDLRGALRLIGDARSGHRRQSDMFPGFLSSYVVIATTLLRMGNVSGAVTVLREGRDLCGTAGESWTRSHLDHLLAQAEYLRGDAGQALGHARDALRVARLFGDVAALAAGVELVGALSALSGDVKDGELLLASAAGMWAELDGHSLRSPVLAEIAAQAGASPDVAAGRPVPGPEEAVALALQETD
ncbi:hypothetical protein Acor_52730 [Acrocarpospora corrugata]|uniref:AAA+ ATPase domain-containing protein n=1 Tax=Acrocarpospora corrugata TaxID=35763 RepID=A0A5M3W289_9ACTN|nr:AAA family ATPase [Acrocarpospora corrugata]GES03207.1 hypothetical protein Acor_52730 [Acrocarpospora corrugata]